MKSKVQKRREACERIKKSLPGIKDALAKIDADLQRPVRKEFLAFGDTVEQIRQSQREHRNLLAGHVQRMKGEIAHLESLG